MPHTHTHTVASTQHISRINSKHKHCERAVYHHKY